MTQYACKNIRDVIAALQQVVREHGSNLTLEAANPEEQIDDEDLVLVIGPDNHPVAEVCINSIETDDRLLKFVTQTPTNARRKNR